MKKGDKEKIQNYDENEGIIETLSEEDKEYQKSFIENRQSFLKRLNSLPEKTVQLIDFAYDLGKEAHRPQKRDTGERYFEHLRNAALILMDECGIKDPDIIISALLHDSVEDSAVFGNATQAYSKWQKTVSFRLGRVFNDEVARMVIVVTKPKVDGKEIKTKEEAHGLYIKNLSGVSAKTILIKMADRLHNLRTLSGTPVEKQKRISAETEKIYFPIFEKALSAYPKEGKIMLDEMKKAIKKLNL